MTVDMPGARLMAEFGIIKTAPNLARGGAHAGGSDEGHRGLCDEPRRNTRANRTCGRAGCRASMRAVGRAVRPPVRVGPSGPSRTPRAA